MNENGGCRLETYLHIELSVYKTFFKRIGGKSADGLRLYMSSCQGNSS